MEAALPLLPGLCTSGSGVAQQNVVFVKQPVNYVPSVVNGSISVSIHIISFEKSINITFILRLIVIIIIYLDIG